MYSEASYACFEHSIFFKVNDSEQQLAVERLRPEPSEPVRLCIRKTGRRGPVTITVDVPKTAAIRNPTTSFLTTTKLVYTIGAGITAAAGTRLALQLVIVKVSKLYSFQTLYL